MKTEILGVVLDDLTLQDAVDKALILMQERRGAYVCTPNPEMLWLSRRDVEFRAALRDADMRLPDGVGDLLAARILGSSLTERVSGIDFAEELLSRMNGSVYLLGAKPGVAERAASNISEKWPAVCVVGVSDGYYSDEQSVIETIKGAKPDLLMVCLGMGRQERFMAKLSGCSEIGLMAGLGGTLDVLAGDSKRAPDFFIRHGLEWLYRFLCRPSRIKRLLRIPLFLAAVINQKFRERHPKPLE